jgi:hypothetical protein
MDRNMSEDRLLDLEGCRPEVSVLLPPPVPPHEWPVMIEGNPFSREPLVWSLTEETRVLQEREPLRERRLREVVGLPTVRKTPCRFPDGHPQCRIERSEGDK